MRSPQKTTLWIKKFTGKEGAPQWNKGGLYIGKINTGHRPQEPITIKNVKHRNIFKAVQGSSASILSFLITSKSDTFKKMRSLSKETSEGTLQFLLVDSKYSSETWTDCLSTENEAEEFVQTAYTSFESDGMEIPTDVLFETKVESSFEWSHLKNCSKLWPQRHLA